MPFSRGKACRMVCVCGATVGICDVQMPKVVSCTSGESTSTVASFPVHTPAFAVLQVVRRGLGTRLPIP